MRIQLCKFDLGAHLLEVQDEALSHVCRHGIDDVFEWASSEFAKICYLRLVI